MPYLSIVHIRTMVAEQYFAYQRSLFGRVFGKKLNAQSDLSIPVANSLKTKHQDLRWPD